MWRFLGDKRETRKSRGTGKIGASMKRKKPAPKMSGLVLAALRNLRDARGSTAKEIMKYIMAEYNASEATVQRQLKTALKRGVEYGILKKTQNGYSLNTDAEVITPYDMTTPVGDACKKKKPACPKKKKKVCKKKKRTCPKKNPCKKKKKKNPCNVCSSRGRKSDCTAPVRLLKESTPTMDDNSCQESENARSIDEDQDNTDGAEQSQDQQGRCRSQGKQNAAGSRSRSPSKAPSQYSEEEDEDDML